MTKKIALCLLTTVLLATAFSAEAQQPGKVHRIGYVFTGLLPPREFLQALREIGYAEGQHVTIEYRGAEGKEDRLPGLAAELVRLKVDVIVVGGGIQAAKQIGLTVPPNVLARADKVIK